MDSKKHILLTIDVEDWFQVENFKAWIPFETWDQRELRVEKSTHRLLDLLDSVEFTRRQASSEAGKPEAQSNELNQPNQHSQLNRPPDPGASGYQRNGQSSPTKLANSINPTNSTSSINSTNTPKATFFVLGWLAERLPNLVREIQSRGHEIASHGCNHILPNQLSPKELKQDLTDSKTQLENISGASIAGYRAPSFAIDNDVLKIIEDAGYLYDSSYNSFDLHGRYGKVSLNAAVKEGIAHKLSDNFYELPISNLPLSTLGTLAHFRHFRHFHIPWGGGGYFRLIPFALFNLGIKSILQKEDAYILYLHPWEIDPDQPRVREASPNFKLRHYSNLSKTQGKLKRLINKSRNCAFVTCREYIELHTSNN